MSDQRHQGEVAGTHWDPSQYAKFADHRLRPALELLARVSLDVPDVVFDLGCGGGDIPRIMRSRWPGARITGIDSSREMLEKAARSGDGIEWVEASVEDWTPDHAPDVIYSNATLHWVAGHDELFPRLLSYLRPGGCLAVQMPLSWGEPSHRLMRETLTDGGPDGETLGDDALRAAVGRKWVEAPHFYYDLLAHRSAKLEIWTTEYLQVLDGDDPVFEWVKATGLRPILNALEGETLSRFVDEYKRRLRDAYPKRPDGRTLYPFPRLFLLARSR